MNYLDAKAEFISWRDERVYRQNIDKTYKESIALTLAAQTNRPAQLSFEQIPMHPAFSERMLEFTQFIETHGALKTINFGDSILDFTREWIDEIDGIFSVAGSWHKHMLQFAGALSIDLINHDVGTVFVGTLAGNPLIGFQDLNATIAFSILTLDGIRSIFPNRKIIIYGLPPTKEVQVIPCSDTFCNAMYDYAMGHQDVQFIDMRYRMGGQIATSRYSADGVHLNPRGARILNQLFKEAKSSTAKLIK